MSQTNTDYLFPSTAPVADRASEHGWTNDGNGTFDIHLSQASTIVRDDPYKPGNAVRGPEPPAYRGPQPDKNSYDNDPRDSGAAGPISNNKETAQPSQSSSPVQDGSAKSVNGESYSTEPHDADDQHNDKPDDKLAGEVAGAAQVKPDNAAQKTAKADSANTASAAANKTKNANDKAVSLSAASEAAANANSKITSDSALTSSSKAQTSELSANLVAPAAAATEAPNDLTAAAGASEHSNDSVASIKQLKEKAAAALRLKSKSNGDTKDGDACHDTLPEGLSNAETAADEAQAAAPNIGTSVSTMPKGASNSEDASPDNPRRQARTGNRSDAASQAIKADAVLLINGTATNAADTSADADPKGDKTEPLTKPIPRNGETATVSLARLTRPNVAVNDSNRGSEKDAPRVDPERFVGRVAKAFQTANDRGGTLQLRLSPPELGALHLELTVKNGVMSANLQTDNAHARRLLLDHLPALRDRLAEQNIRVEKFDVDVRRDGSGGQADARGSQQQPHYQPQQPAPRRHAAPLPQPRKAAPQDTPAIAPKTSDTGLNLIV